jgi:methylglyoxal synthase
MKIALIAHDGKKADMVHFLSGFRDALHRVDIDLVATGTTGSHIERAGFQVKNSSQVHWEVMRRSPPWPLRKN